MTGYICCLLKKKKKKKIGFLNAHNSSVCKEVFKFLLGGRTLNENHNNGKEIPHEDDTPSGFLVRSLPKFLLYPRVSAIKKNVLVSLFLFTKYVIDHNQIIKKLILPFQTSKKLMIQFLLVIFCIKSTVLVLEEDVFNLLKIYTYLLKHMLRLMTYVLILFVS